MMIFLLSVGAVYLLGSVLLMVGIKFAPEGYEDESEFHIVWCNNEPDAADVACVWGLDAAQATA